MSTQELTPDVAARIEAKLDALSARVDGYMLGRTDGTSFHPGLFPQVADLARRVADLERGRGWFKERGLGVLVAVLTAIATTWGVTHTIGGKP